MPPYHITGIFSPKRAAFRLAFAIKSRYNSKYKDKTERGEAAFCLEELAQLQTHLDAVAAKTHPLAYRIADRPQLEMPREYREYLENQK